MITVLFVFIVLGIAIVDQIGKQLVVSSLGFWEFHVVIPDLLNIIHVQNTGGAFGIFAESDSPIQKVLFPAVGTTAFLVLIYLWRTQHKQTPFAGYGYAFMAGGALGNVIDRIRFGWVVDYIDVYHGSFHWPAFNIADFFLSIGMMMIGVSLFLNVEDKTRRR